MFTVKLGVEVAQPLCFVIWQASFCYLEGTLAVALEFVRCKRPRVLLASSQWKAVRDFSRSKPAITAPCSPSGDAELVTKADLEGYHGTYDDNTGKALAVVSRTVRTRPMIARLSCLFALKVSGVCGPVNGQVLEARAC